MKRGMVPGERAWFNKHRYKAVVWISNNRRRKPCNSCALRGATKLVCELFLQCEGSFAGGKPAVIYVLDDPAEKRRRMSQGLYRKGARYGR